jgi:hypothetical protein
MAAMGMPNTGKAAKGVPNTGRAAKQGRGQPTGHWNTGVMETKQDLLLASQQEVLGL